MNHLDDPATYRKLDPSQFFQRLRDLPSQFPRVEGAVAQLRLPPKLGKAHRVLVVGMGGSAIGGELLADVAAYEGSVPVIVWRDYDLPHWVDDRTLVLVCSHSGRTQESLSGFRRAMTLKAPVVVMTGGEVLARESQQAGLPVVPFDYQGEPRSGIGYSFLGPLLLLQRLGLMAPGTRDQWTEMRREVAAMTTAIGEDVPAEHNEAKSLALKMHQRLPVVYGGGILAGVARRWKTQLNENAKSWAVAETLPEAHHNTVEGRLPLSLGQQVYGVLLQPCNQQRLSVRYEATAELFTQRGVDFTKVAAHGTSPLSQIMTTVVLGDYASCYLAMLNGVDPSPVHAIDSMRQRTPLDNRPHVV